MILFVFATYTCELAARWWMEVRAHCAWIAIYTASCARVWLETLLGHRDAVARTACSQDDPPNP